MVYMTMLTAVPATEASTHSDSGGHQNPKATASSKKSLQILAVCLPEADLRNHESGRLCAAKRLVASRKLARRWLGVVFKSWSLFVRVRDDVKKPLKFS